MSSPAGTSAAATSTMPRARVSTMNIRGEGVYLLLIVEAR